MTTPVAPQSPDLDPYAGLTLDPRSAQDLIDEALQDAIAKMPGYVPVAGATEVVLIENLALILAELIQRLNFVPLGVAKALLTQLFQIPRNTGTPASASATFVMADSVARVVPAGTRVGLIIAGQQFVFTTDSELDIDAGAGQGTVGITSIDDTDQANGTPTGTVLVLVDSVSYVQSVTLASAVTGGSVSEDDTSYLNRGAQELRRLTSTLVTPDNFIAAALQDTAVFRATAIDLYDPGSGHQPGQDPGHITVACLDSTGNPLSSADKATLLASLQAEASGQLAIHITDPEITPVDVTATLVAVKGADTGTVEAAAVAALEGYLSPTTWDWSGTVYVNELISLLDQVAGVARVVSITTPAADFALTGAAPLAQYGTLSVTVNPGS